MKAPDQNLSIASLSEAYRNQTLTPRQLVTGLLECCAEHPEYWIHLLRPNEIEPYLDRIEQSGPEGLPLWGIPFAIKDNIDLAGVPTTAACPAYACTPSENAFVVRQLIEAGAIPIGKTNLDQFATGLVGTRSPYGVVRNTFHPDYACGGSSSGSAAAVASGLVSFALGTDTAGSGRVPAAFNNLIGVKPSCGLLSTRGVVPACASLDCVSIFALTPGDAETVIEIAASYDAADPWAREMPDGAPLAQASFHFGVPNPEQLEFFDHEKSRSLFENAVQQMEDAGGVSVEIDITSLLSAAKLLYEGCWVAERYLVVSDLIEKNPDALLPVTRSIIAKGAEPKATDAFRDRYALQKMKRATEDQMAEIDCLLLPTAPYCPTLEQIEQDPIGVNSQLGYYTNCVNLLDLAAVAVPAGQTSNRVPFGVTMLGPAGSDHRLMGLANRYLAIKNWGAGHTKFPMELQDMEQNQDAAAPATIDVAVCGAHLSGMPLNRQLTERGATLRASTTTAPRYKLYALSGGPPERPGLQRTESGGAAIEVEVWTVPAARFGDFVAGIPAPLGIGKLELADGSWVSGFICEPCGLETATDITGLGSWRNYAKPA